MNITTRGQLKYVSTTLWGLVSDAGWNDADAIVVCNQLGYTGRCELTSKIQWC